MKSLSNKLVNCEDRIKIVCRTRFLQRIKYYEEKYGAHLKSIVKFVGNIDMFKSAAKTALNFGYVRPNINMNSEKSYIDFEEIRHPIIERIQSDVNYVTNDVSLGSDKFGLLLLEQMHLEKVV